MGEFNSPAAIQFKPDSNLFESDLVYNIANLKS